MPLRNVVVLALGILAEQPFDQVARIVEDENDGLQTGELISITRLAVSDCGCTRSEPCFGPYPRSKTRSPQIADERTRWMPMNSSAYASCPRDPESSMVALTAWSLIETAGFL